MQKDSVNILPDTTFQAGVLIEQADSIVSREGEEQAGLVLTAPERGRDGLPRPETPATASWAAALLLLIFAILGIRFRANYKFLSGIVTDLTDRGGRHSIFGETVRETFYILALNLLWIVSCGALLYMWVGTGDAVVGMGVAVGCMGVYALWEWITYWVCGNVFSTSRLTAVWLRGLRASQGLAAIGLLPLALGAMFVPSAAEGLIIAAGVVYALVRLVYIWQGFNIFFNRPGGIVPFFYYLCALEIAPLPLVYHATRSICGVMC